ncbi:MAG: cell wall-binding repeat-containing protein [Actinomycetia bacterium]|nr:cell wall-binding repeat-containing protein [Actinomycetes bacterium]
MRTAVAAPLHDSVSALTFGQGDVLWAAYTDSLLGIDATDPRSPVSGTPLKVSDAPILDVYAASGGPLVFVSCGDEGLVCVDGSDLDGLTVAGTLSKRPVPEVEAPDLSAYHGGDRWAFTHAFTPIEGTGEIVPLNVTDPSSIWASDPVEVSHAPIDVMASADGVPVLFLASGGVVSALDVQDVRRMDLVGQVELGTGVTDLATDGEWIYASLSSGDVVLLHWDPSTGLTQREGISSSAGPLAFEGQHAYVATTDAPGFVVAERDDDGRIDREYDVPGEAEPAGAIAASDGRIALSEGDSIILFVHGEPVYRFSTDAGAHWSGWRVAENPGGDTSAPTTLGASAVPFDQDSGNANHIQFRAGDAMGLLSRGPDTLVRIDTQIATVTPESPTHPSEPVWYASDDPVFTWAAPPDISGIAGYSYELTQNVSALPDTVSEGATCTAAFTDVSDGEWYFRIRAVDGAGNWGSATGRKIRIDTTPPDAMFVLEGGAEWATSTVVSCESTATDAHSGVSQMRFTSGSTQTAWMPYAASYDLELGAGEGTRSVTAEFKDAAGNVRSASDAIKVDTAPPTIQSITPQPQQLESTFYSARDTDIAWVANPDLSQAVAFSYLLDHSSGTVPDTAADAETTHTVYTGLTDGTWYFHIRGRDGAGNWGPAMHRTIRIDGTAPAGTMSINAGASYTTSRDVTVTSSVSDANTVVMRHSADGGVTWPSEWQPYAVSYSLTLPSGDGTKTVVGQYRDSAVPPNSLEVTDTIVLDSTPPSDPDVSSPSHPVGVPRSDATIDVQLAGATDALSGVAGFGVTVTADAPATPSSMNRPAPSGSDSFTTSAQADGTYYVNVSTFDVAGNRTSTVHYGPVVIDTTPPQRCSVVSSTHPVETTWYASNDATLSWSVDGGEVAAGYSYTLMPGDVTGPVCDQVVEGSQTATAYADLTDGIWSFHVKAVDAAGNWGPESYRRIRVDATPPAGTFVLEGGAEVSEDIEVSADSAVTDTTALEMRFSVDDTATWDAWRQYEESALLTLPEVEGEHTVFAQYRDAAGNSLELSDTITLELAPPLPSGLLDRWAGSDRYATALEISRQTFTHAGTVVVATGLAFPDALAASGLAGAYEAPLLLTQPGSLSSGIAAEIDRLGASSAIVVGGESAVSADVYNALDALPGVTPTRIFGSNRYATAAAAADEIKRVTGAGFVRRAFVARGDDFADALAVAPLAYSQKMPVLLTQTTVLPGDTRSAITRLGAQECVIAGGVAGVSESVKAAIDALPGVSVERWWGANRYATAVDVATKGVTRGWTSWRFVGIATGASFPDALGGGVSAGAYEGVLLMTAPAGLSPEAASALSAHAADIQAVRIFGGTSAVSSATQTEIGNILR